MSRFRWLVCGLLLGLAACGAAAQSVDAFVGLNALTASQAVANIPRLGGGLYPSFGANLMLLGDLGLGGEVAWRGTPGNYFGEGIRPIYFDFNAVLDPIHISRSIVPELQAGVGAESLRAYQGALDCGSISGCSDYVSANHLSLHLGLAVKVYLTEHIFLRPAADFYFIPNNTQFQTSAAQRFGLSLGYSLGGG